MKFELAPTYDQPPTIEVFNKNHLSRHQPCIIRNCLKNLSINNWTLAHIKEKCGQNEVNVRTGTDKEDYRRGTTYSLKQMQLGEYIDNLVAGAPDSQRSYLAVQNVKHSLPQLHPEMEIPGYIQNLHSGPFLWVAQKGHYEYMHIDPDEGFLMIISGRKSFKLFSYEGDFAAMEPHPLGSPGRTIQSNIDMSLYEPDTDPAILEKVLPGRTCIYGTLNASDALYIPAFFWHQITTQEVTISMNSFWGNGPKYEETSGLAEHGQALEVNHSKFNLGGSGSELSSGSNIDLVPFADVVLKSDRQGLRQAFTYWFQNILEQNRSEQASRKWSRQLSRLDEVLHCFLATQWKQKLGRDVVDMVTEIAKEYYELESLPEKLEDDTSKFPPLFSIKGLKLRPRPKVPGCKY